MAKEADIGTNAHMNVENQLKLLSLAVDQSTEGLAITDLDGNLTYLNHAFAKMHGYLPEELIGRNLIIFHSPEQLSSVESANQEIKRVGFFKGEIWHTKRDGTILPTMMHNSLIRDENGNPIGMLGTIRDISDLNATRQLKKEIEERKQVEADLRESEKKFKAIFDNMQDVFVRTNKEGRIVMLSPSAAGHYGVDSTDEIIGEMLAESLYYRPEYREQALLELMKKGCLQNYETFMKKKDGTPIPVEINARLLEDGKGNVIGTEGIIRDITDRKEAEMALRESEEHLRSLLESATNFAVYRLVFDKQHPYRFRVIFVSPSISEIMSVSDPMNFETWFENIHPGDRKRVLEANSRAYETFKFNEVLRCHHPTKEGWRWIHAVFTGIPDEKNRLKYANGILIDVTERKRAERALEEKTLNLAETNTALKVLLKKRDKDKTEIEEKVLLNIKELLEPYLEKLKKSGLNGRQMTFVNVLESNLKDLISSFTQKLSSKLYNLTPAELKVANFIKHGKTTKEIASFLNLSPKTVKNHRGSIRKKLEITSTQINLRSYLLSIG